MKDRKEALRRGGTFFVRGGLTGSIQKGRNLAVSIVKEFFEIGSDAIKRTRVRNVFHFRATRSRVVRFFEMKNEVDDRQLAFF